MTLTPQKMYCNCVALERGLDPVGSAGDYDDAVIIEAPLPWSRKMSQKAGTLPQQAIDLLGEWLRTYYSGAGYRHLMLVVAPDPEYSREGYRRVMFFNRPQELFSVFEKHEYLVPEDQVGTLVWALYKNRAALVHFEQFRVLDAQHIRDILVCTHGTVDAACSKFGYPLYKHLRTNLVGDHLRVWRVSHFGGHVFAPTFMDMPSGHYWAYVEASQAEQIVLRIGNVAKLRGHYRGNAAFPYGFAQAAERELWQHFGWSWFDMPKSGYIVDQSDEDAPSKWANVRLQYLLPGELDAQFIDLHVEISHTVTTPHSSNAVEGFAYPQYRVVTECPTARAILYDSL